MQNKNILAAYELPDGTKVNIENLTSHYYGGFFYVRLHVAADIPLTANMFESQTEFDKAQKLLGSTLRFERMLEKMAVPEGDVESVRQSLLKAFEGNMLPYLSRREFSSRFVLSEYEKHLKSGTLSRGKLYGGF